MTYFYQIFSYFVDYYFVVSNFFYLSIHFFYHYSLNYDYFVFMFTLLWQYLCIKLVLRLAQLLTFSFSFIIIIYIYIHKLFLLYFNQRISRYIISSYFFNYSYNNLSIWCQVSLFYHFFNKSSNIIYFYFK
jgi:hypothetical protein